MKTRLAEISADSKYTLVVKEGFYGSDGFLHLFWLVLTHRIWHLFRHRRWCD